MFGPYTYLGYTLIFCLPPLVLLWARAEFARSLRRDLAGILIATVVITLYGCAIWPLAIRWRCWRYDETRILNRELFGYVFVEDVVWWALVSFLVASFVALATRREELERDDVVLREASGLLRSFRAAFAGFRVAAIERNMTIHLAAAAAAILAAWLFRLPRLEWLLVIVAIAGVVAAELLNCAIERLAPGPAELACAEVRLLKDAAAAGVLVMSIAAASIGTTVFLPRALSACRLTE